MADITAGMVKELRERTGAGMMECKKALTETDGDIEKAIDLLRAKGAAKAAKRADREAAEGVTAIAALSNGKDVALVELNCETDFVANTDDFRAAANHLAELVAGLPGKGAVDVAQVLASPMGAGTVADHLTQLSAKTGEKIELRRAARISGNNVGQYMHHNAKVAVLVEIDGGHAELAREIAMHIAMTDPVAITVEEIPADVVERERAVYQDEVKTSGKPEAIWDKIVDGKLRRFFEERALLKQAWVRDDKKRIEQLLEEAKGAVIRQFHRFKVGD